MYNNSDELVIVLNAVESTCAVKFYTVVDTFRSPVHNIPCPLHWVRDNFRTTITVLFLQIKISSSKMWAGSGRARTPWYYRPPNPPVGNRKDYEYFWFAFLGFSEPYILSDLMMLILLLPCLYMSLLLLLFQWNSICFLKGKTFQHFSILRKFVDLSWILNYQLSLVTQMRFLAFSEIQIHTSPGAWPPPAVCIERMRDWNCAHLLFT